MPGVGLARRILRRIGYSGWALVSAVLVFLAGASLIAAIGESSSEDNRAPAGRIVIAALATVSALTAAYVVARHVRGRRIRIGVAGGLLLTWTTVLLLFALFVVDIVSGPL
jgi:hypothetical protein